MCTQVSNVAQEWRVYMCPNKLFGLNQDLDIRIGLYSKKLILDSNLGIIKENDLRLEQMSVRFYSDHFTSLPIMKYRISEYGIMILASYLWKDKISQEKTTINIPKNHKNTWYEHNSQTFLSKKCNLLSRMLIVD